jgi:tetratricopeptide (TPR) repeat protein
VLQDLNYVRDSFSDKVPYPLVFFLPDYAITRLAKFAPDFWAWQLGIFEFHTPPEGEPTQETIDPKILQQQLDELQKLLEKHSHTQRTTTLTTQKIYAQITRLYRNLGQENADPVFRTVLQLPPLMPRQVDILRWWGTLKRDSGHTDESLKLYQQALEIEAKIKDDRNEARTLQELAVLYNDRKDFERAQKLIQNALEIHRKLGDTNVQAKQFLESLEKSKKAIGLEQSAYREAQKGNTQKAIELYTELLDLYEELGNPDRLVIARTNDSLAELLDQIDAKLQTPLSWRDRIFSRGHP